MPTTRAKPGPPKEDETMTTAHETQTTDARRPPQAKHIMVVTDGVERYAVRAAAARAWLRAHGLRREYDLQTHIPYTARMSADQYEDFCVAVPMLAGLTPADLDRIEASGAALLRVG